ncbi:MAG TPA: ATP-binding protein [Chitinophagaceae bacterium]|nr:ATP-binding protein [Chitinophagaceae bacterium]
MEAWHVNNQNITLSLDFLREIIVRRLELFFNRDSGKEFGYPEINLIRGDDYLSNFLAGHNINIEEFAVLLIALAPHVQPNFFENIIQQYLPQGGDFAEMGGIKGTNYRGMLPTGETAQFIAGGYDFAKRLYVQRLLQQESVLVKENILWLEDTKEGEPAMSGRIILSGEWLNKLLTGAELPPRFSADFPARKINTGMQWDDLVLNAYTHSLINDVKTWLQYNAVVMQDEVLKKKVKPGYRVLFYGPPGTGKTLTATLLGKQFDRDVYRVDLSQIVSKYIGETEKNLEKVFNKAVNKDWILFFDEADALFGKRTNVQNAHDRYANQEVSYLLQRIEDFPGLLILASNFKSNMDEAFLRRFQTVVHFPAPNMGERLKLWEKTLPSSIRPEASLNLAEISEKYELTGAAILNIVHYATLQTISKSDGCIRRADILEGIKREFRKEEKTISH